MRLNCAFVISFGCWFLAHFFDWLIIHFYELYTMVSNWKIRDIHFDFRNSNRLIQKWFYFVPCIITSKCTKFQIFWTIRFGCASFGSWKFEKNRDFMNLVWIQIARWRKKIFKNGFRLLIYHFNMFILKLKPFWKYLILALPFGKMCKKWVKITLKCPAIFRSWLDSLVNAYF